MLSLRDLSVSFRGRPVLRNLSLDLAPGETLGLVGESGSGKSMTALALMGLLPPGFVASGSIRLDGNELLGLADADLCRLRGRAMAMIFQEPMTALNPVLSVGAQIAEGLVLHGLMAPRAAREEAIRLMERVGLPDPARRARSYPHELSGGQRQRAMIAMAIACRPALLIADEPTSALDVSLQVEILALLREIRDETGMAMIFISHDLSVIHAMADRALVLYGGLAMETGPTRHVIGRPSHPYTQGLIAAIPRGSAHTERLRPIPGQVPDLSRLPPGCPFAGRCDLGDARCAETLPPLRTGLTALHCHHAELAPA
ncbi:ABC transporter ATP-binding protein [Rhabdaerophilum sp. SD176]|uniref:ABC transporter ATP-binding protein n=1 Tax=Rhabdaerophilum sp. SD176 TaxID=2983548 RepID=UPI0024DF90C0|nr:ABC transporter ATP-binding protein [Rhabdaerophilum sp. SD176]